MSSDHRDRAGPSTIAAENGATGDEDHLESSGDVTAVLARKMASSGRLPTELSVPTTADVGAIERILRQRHGIGVSTGHTLEKVGRNFLLTRERIRQIEAKALRELQHPSKSRRIRSFLDA